MEDWQFYLDTDFSPPSTKYRCKDTVFVKCPICKKTGKKLLNNLKIQIKKIGEYRCKSCASSLATSCGGIKNQVLEKLKSMSLQHRDIGEYKTARSFTYRCLECGDFTTTSLGNFLKTSFTGKCRPCAVSLGKTTKHVFNRLNAYLAAHGYPSYPEGKTVQSKDLIELSCFDCGIKTAKSVGNLLKNEGKSPPLCKSCGGKRSATPNAITQKKATMLRLYGVENPMQNFDTKTKAQKTCQKKYGAGGSQAIARKAFQEKYKVKNPFDLPKIQEKLKETNLKKYGQVNKKRADFLKKNNVQSEPELVENVVALLKKTKLHCNHPKIYEHFKTNGVVLTRLLNKYNYKEYLQPRNTSTGEKELAGFIESIYKGTVLKNTRDIISPLELDVYLPKEKIAFEYNGLYWHSLKTMDTPAYHMLKRQYCEKLGIQLIQINEDEWQQKQDIVKSLIKNKLKIKSNTIGARQTVLRKVSLLKATEFLAKNHLMGGSARGVACVGLYKDNVLVSLLTYRKDQKGVLDIVRFCNLLNHSIPGGLSKLLKHITLKENPKELQSFVDLRYANGHSLVKLGFIPQKPFLSWKWTDYKSTYNRLYCKANMDARGLSEKEHAEEKGLVRLYDAGQQKFVLKKEGAVWPLPRKAMNLLG